MRARHWSIRTKIVALLAVPLVSLVALWLFATTLTLGPARNLLATRVYADTTGLPLEEVMAELQAERKLSQVYLGAGRTAPAPLRDQRARTDAVAARFRTSSTSGAMREAATPVISRRLTEMYILLDTLTSVRSSVDNGEVDRTVALASYTDRIEAAYQVLLALADLDDRTLAHEARAIIALSQAREVLSQEDAHLHGVAAAGRFITSDHRQLVQLIGTQRFLYNDASAALPPQERAAYLAIYTGDAHHRLRALEDLAIDQGRTGGPLPVSLTEWQAAYQEVYTSLRELEVTAADQLADRAQPVAITTFVRLGLAALVGLIAVVLSIVVSARIGRSLVHRLGGLRRAALALARERLPSVVARLRRGEEVDIAAETPPLDTGPDEIGELGRAFDLVQATAVGSAVEEARVRGGLNEVFLNIARRSQTLLHRQLALLDRMERRTTDPDDLEDLFRVDHLATRMRRHAEDLVILAGSAPGRGWRNPVPMIDVIRGAVSEVEDYARITLRAVPDASLAGRAVADAIHLLAELLENATSFSPPHTRVHVAGELVPNGYAIEIEDRGLGMSNDAIDEANRRLADPGDFDPANSARLGLVVVGVLAARHGVRVQLRQSPYGGVTAVALLPADLITSTAPEAAWAPERPPLVLEPAGPRAPQPSLTLPAPRRPALEPPEPAEPLEPAPDLTDDGLPRRIRSSAIEPTPEGDDEVAAADVSEPIEADSRTPDELRALMTALQSGTTRGRRDADAPTVPIPAPEAGERPPTVIGRASVAPVTAQPMPPEQNALPGGRHSPDQAVDPEIQGD